MEVREVLNQTTNPVCTAINRNCEGERKPGPPAQTKRLSLTSLKICKSLQTHAQVLHTPHITRTFTLSPAGSHSELRVPSAIYFFGRSSGRGAPHVNALLTPIPPNPQRWHTRRCHACSRAGRAAGRCPAPPSASTWSRARCVPWGCLCVCGQRFFGALRRRHTRTGATPAPPIFASILWRPPRSVCGAARCYTGTSRATSVEGRERCAKTGAPTHNGAQPTRRGAPPMCAHVPCRGYAGCARIAPLLSLTLPPLLTDPRGCARPPLPPALLPGGPRAGAAAAGGAALPAQAGDGPGRPAAGGGGAPGVPRRRARRLLPQAAHGPRARV